MATALAIHFAWYSYQRSQGRIRVIEVAAPAASPSKSVQRPGSRPVQRRPQAVDDPPYELKAGERCLNGKFIYQVTVDHWADAPGQDWKCRGRSGR